MAAAARTAAQSIEPLIASQIDAPSWRKKVRVLVATPIDLRRVIEIRKPALRVGYELQEIGRPDLADALAGF